MSASALVLFIKGVYYSFQTLCGGSRVLFNSKIKKDILVCGNGPSLTEIDLQKVYDAGVAIAVVNFFPLYNSCFFTIKPRYLFLLDPDFFVPYDMLREEIKQLLNVLEKVDWDMKIVSGQGNYFRVSNDHIRHEHISKFSLKSDILTNFIDWLYTNDLVVTGTMNVVIAALFYFINRTEGTIYLSGVDMSDITRIGVDGNNEMYIYTKHNYGDERIPVVAFKKGEFYKLVDMYKCAFEEFYYTAKYAKRKRVSVINLSIESCLDMFEKKQIDSWKIVN